MRADKKNLAAGIREMRSVAKRLMAWADDLEKNSGTGGVEAVEEAAVGSDAVAAVGGAGAGAVGCGDASGDAVPTRAEVKGFLAKLCAAGHSAQVKALIASCGVTSLSGVPEDALGDLWNAALLLEGEEDAG